MEIRSSITQDQCTRKRTHSSAREEGRADGVQMKGRGRYVRQPHQRSESLTVWGFEKTTTTAYSTDSQQVARAASEVMHAQLSLVE